MGSEPVLQLLAVEPIQRHFRHFDLEATPMPQKAIDENLACVTEANALRSFVQCADEHKAPETLDGSRRLPMAPQPIAKWRVGAASRAPQAQQCPGDAGLFGQI